MVPVDGPMLLPPISYNGSVPEGDAYVNAAKLGAFMTVVSTDLRHVLTPLGNIPGESRYAAHDG